jgi:hypothetical protein
VKHDNRDLSATPRIRPYVAAIASCESVCGRGLWKSRRTLSAKSGDRIEREGDDLSGNRFRANHLRPRAVGAIPLPSRSMAFLTQMSNPCPHIYTSRAASWTFPFAMVDSLDDRHKSHGTLMGIELPKR